MRFHYIQFNDGTDAYVLGLYNCIPREACLMAPLGSCPCEVNAFPLPIVHFKSCFVLLHLYIVILQLAIIYILDYDLFYSFILHFQLSFIIYLFNYYTIEVI